MMNRPNTAPRQNDTPLLGGILLRLALPRLLTRMVIILAAIALVVYCAQRILLSGKAWLEFVIKGTGLSEILGKTVIDFVMQYQRYLWWFVILILVLIAISGLMSYLRNSLKRGRAALVPLSDVRKLCAQLSPESLDILNWVWKDQSQPITVGVLQTVLAQRSSGRARKLALARAQQFELQSALEHRPVTMPGANAPTRSSPPSNGAGQREPTLLA
jgi:DNA-binding Xre family transcriptional regulator